MRSDEDAALPRLLTVMGSGETSPTMVKTHRALLERLGPPPVPAVLMDTPFGFQENAAEITEKAVAYFAESVGATIEVAGFRSAAETADTVAHEKMLGRLRRARYVFAGPGSPSYALAQWKNSAVPGILADKLEQGGAVTFASAAALTLGLLTVPVYEIYKVGADPRWLDGLDLLRAAGLSAAVIPHYNNAEGGNHDTRFCYLGERRLRRLEEELPEDTFVLGVDEHTGLVIDLDAGTAEVVGLGVVTVRCRGRSAEVLSGETLTIDQLRSLALKPAGPRGAHGESAAASTGPVTGGTPRAARSPLLEAIGARQAAFDAAVADRDGQGAVAAALGLDDDLAAWAADTLQSDERDRGRAVLRSMIVSLGDLAETGLQDPRRSMAPFVELVLGRRRLAREERRFAEADALRDELVALGIEIQDRAEGTDWDLRSGAGQGD
ncbi:MAG: CysS/YqeB C-terminal domain-containing protein [Acidimicrobiales bacterium]